MGINYGRLLGKSGSTAGVDSEGGEEWGWRGWAEAGEGGSDHINALPDDGREGDGCDAAADLLGEKNFLFTEKTTRLIICSVSFTRY